MNGTVEKIFFNNGPTRLPNEVLKQAQSEFLDYQGTGLSILETIHRSNAYKDLNQQAQNDLRQILSIPDNYEVLFLQGGATAIFSAIPLNVTSSDEDEADYIVTGLWSRKASKEANNYCKVNTVLPDGECCTDIPDSTLWRRSPNARYLYYCDNDTVNGIEFPFIPESNGVPLFCDVSSNILTKPIDIQKFGAIFAGAQKNLGCAGVTVVIVRKDLLGNARRVCPSILNWKSMGDAASILNTPPTFSIYIMSLMLQWVIKNGGVEEMERRSMVKSSKIYDIIDASNGFYCCPVEKGCRSRVTITFRIGGPNGDVETEKKFLSEAKECGLYGLEGYRTVGGIRVCLYNAVSIDDTEKLVSFMGKFKKQYIM